MYKSRASEFQVSYFVSFCSRSNLGTALSTWQRSDLALTIII
jgi:hypothetical protein